MRSKNPLTIPIDDAYGSCHSGLLVEFDHLERGRGIWIDKLRKEQLTSVGE
jgi:hypothetical protein